MRVSHLVISGCWTVEPSVHREYRGDISSLYNSDYAGQPPSCPPFVEDKIARSYNNVLRGFHGDYVTDKLLACLHGDVMLAVVDARPWSPTFGKSAATVLSSRDRTQVFIPKGVLNAHYCLTDECLFWYKLSSRYSGPDKQVSVRWDTVGVRWPTQSPILSDRDASAPSWHEIRWDNYTQDGSQPRTVAVSGYFNPLHNGHLDMIEAASKLGTSLVAIVNNDYQVSLKGSVPFMPQRERVRIIGSLRAVDDAILSVDDDRSVCKTLEQLRPAVFCNGGDVTEPGQTREAEVCERLGIEMVFNVGGGKTQSSSGLLGKLLRND